MRSSAEDFITELEYSENLTVNLRRRTRENASLLPEYAEEPNEIVAVARSAFAGSS